MNKKVLTFGLIGAILIGFLLWHRDRKTKGEISDVHLKPGERTAIIVDTNTGEVTTIEKGTPNGTGVRSPLLRGRDSKSTQVSPDTIKRTDGARDIRISIDDKGNVSYTFRTWGFQFSPEAGVCYASTSHTGISLNDSFFFYKRHGALVGLRFALEGGKDIKPYVAYTYNPGWKYINNTSLVIGVDLDKQLVIGTSTHF